MAKQTIQLCAISEFPDAGSKGFSLSNNQAQQDIFVIRRDNQWYAYQNSCPHLGLPLNWQADQFLDVENTYIQCSAHGALFQIEDGLCVWGPCVNQSLAPVRLRISDAHLVVDNPIKQA